MGPGRTKLTPNVRDRIVEAVRAGSYLDEAFRAAGIGVSTGHQWIAWGSGRKYGIKPVPADTAPFVELAEMVEQASAEAEMAALEHWRSAFSSDWRACAEWLRRRYPERWGRDRVEVFNMDAEQLGAHFAGMFRDAMDAPEVGLTAEQEEAVRIVLPRVMAKYCEEGDAA